MPERTFLIQVTGAVRLTKSQLWPDGDGPENPTVEDVEELIEESGGISCVIRDWGLEESFEPDVAVAAL